MPIYEYRCLECDRQFERMQKFSDPAIEVCPCDRAAAVQKLISRSAFHLKGSGWYVTDYGRGGSKGNDNKPEKTEKSSSESSAPESTPASTPTTSSSSSSSSASPSTSAAAD